MKTLMHFIEHYRLMLAGIAAFAAALAFNNWLLGLVFNRRLLYAGGSISELSVHSQPHALVFEALDIVSGLLFAAYALLIKKLMPKISYSGYALIYGTIIFGLANCVDALFTLPCAETLDPSCHIPLHITWSHFNFPSHGYSSVIIAICYLALPIAGYFFAKVHRRPVFYSASVLAVIVAVISLISAVWQYLALDAFTVNASGWAQGAQMLVVGVWFICWYISMRHHPSDNKQPI